MFNKIISFALTFMLLSFSALVFNSCAQDERTTLEKIMDDGVFTVVGSGGYPPFNYYDENDEVVGFDVDTGLAIAEALGVDLNYETSAWDGLIDGLKAGHYDAILGSMAITEERLKEVSFTIPYYYSGAQVVVRADSDIVDPFELMGRDIAVATGTTFEDDAYNLGANPVLYEDDNQTLLELINGRVDAVITDRLVVIRAMQEMAGGENLMMIGDLLRTEEMALAIRQEDEGLLEKLNDIIRNLHWDGVLSQISYKWFDGEDISQ